MSSTIKVGIAECKICSAPDLITTIGLGSCVGVVLYDEHKKIAGLLHVMLPDSTKIKDNSNRAKFANTGIDLLLENLYDMGINKKDLKAKLAGGARMFSFSSDSNIGNVGQKNGIAVTEKLEELKIPIISSDLGKNYGRTIIFNPEDCTLTINSAGKVSVVI